jgi:hypothetical protein
VDGAAAINVPVIVTPVHARLVRIATGNGN